MRYAKTVASSVKGGVDVELGQKTVIVGPNGSGKTSIVQSLELATKGWASDIEGRDRAKLGQSLARLFSDQSDMWSKVEFSDGMKFSWSMQQGTKKGSFKDPVPVVPFNVEWPVFDTNKILLGGDKTVRGWLEKQVCGAVSEDKLWNLVSPASKRLLQPLVNRLPELDILALAAAARNEARRLRAAATTAENTIDSLVQGTNPPLPESGVAKLRAQLEKLVSVKGISRAEYDRAASEVEKCKGRITAQEKELSALPVAEDIGDGLIEKLRNTQELISRSRQLSKDSCIVCGADEANLDARLTEVAVLLKDRKQAAARVNARRVLENRLEQAKAELSRQKTNLAALIVAPDTLAEQRALRDKLAADLAAKQVWQKEKIERIDVATRRENAAMLSLGADSLELAGKKELKRAKGNFETQISSFLPAGEDMAVDLGSARLGFDRSGSVHTALSGAESSRLLLALTSYLAGSDADTIIVPPDRAWDAATLTREMEALAHVEAQIIIMSTVEPDAVAGWTIVNL